MKPKTNIYQHSGSSIRVPIDEDVRSASSELGPLSKWSPLFDYPGTVISDPTAKD